MWRKAPELKLIYVAIDGMGDLPIAELGNKTPLEAANTPHLDFLAKNGKIGLMYTVKKGVAPESDVAVISLLGYDPFKYSTGRGVIEAVGAGLEMKNGDLALRCNFATLGKDREIIDRRVKRTLTTKEALELSDAVNKKVTLESCPATFQFKSTLGHRAVLLFKGATRCLSGKISNSDPAYSYVNGIGEATPDAEMVLKKSEPLEDTEEARNAANLVNEFIEKTHEVWENHPVNKKRAAEGKLKANCVLTRDAGSQLPQFFNISERYKVRFAALSDMQAESGIAHLAGMEASLLPPPSGDLEKDCAIRVKKLLDILPLYDVFYIHLKGPDEPGHDGNCHLKTQIIAAIDTYFFGPLLKEISLKNHIFCVTCDHATPCSHKVHTDTPVPMLISGGKVTDENVSKFSEKTCENGSLGTLDHAYELMPKLMKLLK
ncbi:2,3-bisphosphoglycerate-independent phosphoglycerate mutase [Candidatus Bathyarchaeota archaeon]|nr:2,3-bisphosphoglycerate-independent phosphoglycerate mutase [Candidatus Bathyarchaeota archaeon]